VLTHLIANCRVRSVAWTPDGTKIASGSNDKTIKVWNAQTGQCVSTLTGHSHIVTSVAWNNDGTKLAFGSYYKTVRISPSV
jgi:WD40 repeat protein